MSRSTEKQTPTPSPAGDEPITEVVEEQVPLGVFVAKIVGEDGSISTDVQPLGGVAATEIQTILELGVKTWRAKIGLD